VLSDMATREPDSFRAVVARVQEALTQAAPASAKR
jgi:hypothetical protein